jgi:hypothetical protein
MVTRSLITKHFTLYRTPKNKCISDFCTAEQVAAFSSVFFQTDGILEGVKEFCNFIE